MRIAVAAVGLVFSGCGMSGSAALRDELREQSASTGLALVNGESGFVRVIPFDGAEAFLVHDRLFGEATSGKAGQMVLWVSRRNVTGAFGSFELNSTSGGRELGKGTPSMPVFDPICLSESANRIAFWGQPSGGRAKGLYWAPLDLSEIHLVSADNDYPLADWSPDGQSLVFERGGQLFVFDIATAGTRLLTRGRYPDWNPSGGSIAFTGPDGSASLVGINGSVLTWPLSGHKPITPLRWSPGGRYVSFTERPPRLLFLVQDQLVVVRVSDGASVIIERSAFTPSGIPAVTWTLGYRSFCAACVPNGERVR